MTATLEWLASTPTWARRVLGVALGVALPRMAWAGRWWGVGALAIAYGFVFAALWLANQALDEADL